MDERQLTQLISAWNSARSGLDMALDMIRLIKEHKPVPIDFVEKCLNDAKAMSEWPRPDNHDK